MAHQKCLIVLPQTQQEISRHLIKMSGFVATNSWKLSWLLILKKCNFVVLITAGKYSDILFNILDSVATNTTVNVSISHQKHPVLLSLTGLKMSWHLIKTIWFCLQNMAGKCPQILPKNDLMSRHKYLVLLPLTWLENVKKSCPKMSWLLITNVLFCFHKCSWHPDISLKMSDFVARNSWKMSWHLIKKNLILLSWSQLKNVPTSCPKH